LKRSVSPGFSLLELLIALAIVAILASITVPSYRGLVAKARRGDAIAALLAVQLAQERWRTSHAAYAASLADLGLLTAASPQRHYRLHILAADGQDFVAVAEPQGSQRTDVCGSFAVRSAAPVHEHGYAGPACWNR
jgi:type IV pilus assembly protein PilE